MAVSLATSSSTFNNTSDSSTITLPFTCSGTDRFLLVCAETDFDASPTMTFNGSAMTLYTSQRTNGGSGNDMLSIFYTIAPTTSLADIVLSKTNSWGGIMALCFNSVHQVSPIGGGQVHTGNGINPSVTLSTTAGDMAVSFVFGNNPTTFTANNGQTKIVGPNFNPGMINAGYVLNGTTISWTLNVIQQFVLIGIPILQAAAAGASIKTVNGLAQASVQTFTGLANASTKTFNGTANV